MSKPANHEAVLKQALTDGQHDICPECDGEGTVWDSHSQSWPCGECEGEGIVWKEGKPS